ncbi:Gfo/Idh/MocA family protein [Fimbriiglobus ruber]|uniref:Oxidoreductase, Gfo/Idh/MocA family n=1 Tax=Fimbriiglobus ruber TaxID=1908690 RepID=A0A225DI19_9BACT|nr:Gfo/Idh/MocA family oxidoreductase [Fimbriiglobus ruber]OWK36015.1 Oxidoreductase, Gfo/Idh/MocA family [Fimbriiglobus ruber]
MSQKIRWGILGVAAINDRLMEPFHTAKTSDIRAIASRTLPKAKDYAAKNNIPVAYGSYEELLQDPNIDAVYIPLPNHMHDEWTRKAADHGKHVLVEKPMTVHAKEAEALVAYCRSKNVRLMDGFMWPHHPRTHKLRKFLDGGAIGDVKKVVAAFTFNLEGLPTGNIRMQPQAGGGGLLDVGCYTTYAIRWWMKAEPVKVFARAAYVNDVDVGMSGVWTFADGRTATFDCGFTHPLRTWVEIVGTEGVVRVPNMWIPDDQAVFQVVRQKGLFDQSIEEIATPGENQMVHMLDDFAAAVFEKREPYPNPDEAVKTGKVLDALAKSAREGREVEVG